MDGSCMCCGGLPVVTIPVIILAPHMNAPPLPTAPADWQPSNLENVKLDYDRQNENYAGFTEEDFN